MTWAEFQLRLIGFSKAEERELYKIRRLAWTSLIAPYQDPKRLRGLREDKWWRIGEKHISVSEQHKQRFIEEYKKYLDKKEHGRA